MGIIIDTNILIDAECGRFELSALQRFYHYGDAYISVVTMSELLVGVHIAKDMSTKLKRKAFVENILTHIPTLDFNAEISRTYAELCAYFLKKNTPLKRNAHDLQIAATAIHYGYSVLTRNKNDFQHIPGILIETL